MKSRKRRSSRTAKVTSSSLRILLVDDYQIVRSGLRRGLSRRFPGATFECASNGDEALAAVTRGPFNLILLDPNVPCHDGLQLLPELRGRCGHTPILVVTTYPGERFGLASVAAGASGFVEKDVAIATLIRAVEKVLEGGIYLSSKLARNLSVQIRERHGDTLSAHFSPLELAVFERIAAGRTARQIRAEFSRDARRSPEAGRFPLPRARTMKKR
jgi:DNA-binding NarL/FixJ family response regulator